MTTHTVKPVYSKVLDRYEWRVGCVHEAPSLHAGGVFHVIAEFECIPDAWEFCSYLNGGAKPSEIIIGLALEGAQVRNWKELKNK